MQKLIWKFSFRFFCAYRFFYAQRSTAIRTGGKVLMKIFKILNNNVAVILNEDGQEQIVMGRGICFKKRAGDEIPDDMIDKEFHLSTPEAHLTFADKIG